MKRILIFSAFLYLLGIYFSKGYHHVDEHFQLLEFAGLKMGTTTADNLPWEYKAQMRPAFQPAIAYSVWSVMKPIDNNPFHIALVLRLLSAILAVTATWLFYRDAISKELSTLKLKSLYVLLASTLWCVLYLNVRFSSETWSGLLFLLGLTFILRERTTKYTDYLLAGLMLGMSFECRYQTGFMLLGLGLWIIFIKKLSFSNILLLIAGFVPMLGIGFLLDKWLYGEWVLAPVNYFTQNLVAGKAAEFGVSPPWYYLVQTTLMGIPPFSLILIGSIIMVFVVYPRHYLTWIFLPFLLVHHLIGHKELRFMFSMVNFIPAFICLAGVWIHQHQDKTFSSIVHRSIGSYTFRISFIGINILLVLLRLTVPADMRNPLYQAVYKAEPYLHHTIYYQDNNPFLLDGKEPFNFYKKYPQEMKLEKFQDSIPDSQLPCLVIWPVNQSRMLISNLYNKGYHADYLFTTFPQYLYQMIPATQRIDDQWALLAISRKQ